MRILLLEPYDTGSHGAWLRGYAASSAHEVGVLTLKGQFWKWRMHGGAVTLAHRFLDQDLVPDVILATDMVDVTTFLALTRRRTHSVPVALSMHENQLTYPLQLGEKRDLHYGFVNYASMLCANKILFNSRYHLDTWFDELPRLLKHFPDHTELHTVAELEARSEVLPLGLDLRSLDAYRTADSGFRPPLIVWNHRWEYDKDPETFFHALYVLDERGADYQVAILGEHFVRVPPVFDEARQRLGTRVVHFGYAPSRAEYARWLWRGDVLVSTARHEFFGASVVEGTYCGCWSIVPHRLAYPELIPVPLHDRCLYGDFDELVALLTRALSDADTPAELRTHVARYDWSRTAPRYDQTLSEVAEGG